MCKWNIIILILLLLILFYKTNNLEKFVSNNKKNTYWAIVNIPSYKNRYNNVKQIIKNYPFINYYTAYSELDECCKFLAKHNIYISKKYWNNSKNIHLGKVGNTCSILSFIYHLKNNNYEYGVWIEDDLILSQDNINYINYLIKNHKFEKPIIRLIGIGLEVIIIKTDLSYKLIEPIKQNNIYNPPDAIWNDLNLIEQKNIKIKRMDETLSSSNSTILTTKIFKIKDINNLINKYKNSKIN